MALTNGKTRHDNDLLRLINKLGHLIPLSYKLIISFAAVQQLSYYVKVQQCWCNEG